MDGIDTQELRLPSGGERTTPPGAMELDTVSPAQRLSRRLSFFSLVLLSAVIGVMLMLDIVLANGTSIIEAAIVPLFALNFVWISMSFWTAVIGFLGRLAERWPGTRRHAAAIGGPIRTRTAVVMPIYNEDPARVFAGLQATYLSLAATGCLAHFDFYVLSDSNDPARFADEERAWADLRNRLGACDRLFYRRRRRNTGRKAGNIAEFCRNWGSRYDHMVVLDADSIMAGAALVKLVRLMQSNPRVGLIQTVPILINGETLFARAVQFVNRLCGPMMAAGIHYWQLGDSNYWGHNAIIRTAAFTRHCGLPALPGKAPLGGEILSHDFVEAALLRRAGWSVWLVPDIGGSYEEMPSNIGDFAQRDRRWCQGNLQHQRLLIGRGLVGMSRLHLACGGMSYLSSAIWFLLLILSTIEIVVQTLTPHVYFAPGYNLFPVWPVSKTAETFTLFMVTIGMLVAPKLLAAMLALLDRDRLSAFGGRGRLLVSLLLEQIYSALHAPLMMVFHTRFVIANLCGRSVSWTAQPRGERGIGLNEALALHGGQTALGAIWAGVLLSLAPTFFWWFLPVLTGLVLAVPISMLSSRARIGAWLHRHGVFLTPAETTPAPVLRLFAVANQCEPALPRLAAHVPPAPRRRGRCICPRPRRAVMAPQALAAWSPVEALRCLGTSLSPAALPQPRHALLRRR